MTGPYRTIAVGEPLTEEERRLIRECFVVKELSDEAITILGKRTPADGLDACWGVSFCAALHIFMALLDPLLKFEPPLGFRIARWILLISMIRFAIGVWPPRPRITFRRGNRLVAVERAPARYEIPFPLFSHLADDCLTIGGIRLHSWAEDHTDLPKACRSLERFTLDPLGARPELDTQVVSAVPLHDGHTIGDLLLVTKVTAETLEIESRPVEDSSGGACVAFLATVVLNAMILPFVLINRDPHSGVYMFLSIILPNAAVLGASILAHRALPKYNATKHNARIVFFRGMRAVSFEDVRLQGTPQALTGDGISFTPGSDSPYIKIHTAGPFQMDPYQMARSFEEFRACIAALRRYVGQEP